MDVIRRGISLIPLVFLVATSASAQATRTWVSGVGDDANPCSRTAPCKTFAGAISKTAASGEINVIDPGGFGGVTITKNMTIDGGGGVTAGVLATAGTDGISISGANIIVTLRNLDLHGTLTADSGINILNAKQVNIEHCVISEFTNGITTALGGVTARVQIVDSQITNSVQNGILAGNGAIISINDSIVTGNATAGISVAGTAKVLSSNTSLSLNGVGVYVNGAGPQVLLTHNDIFFNTGAPFQLVGGGVLYSYIDNRIQGTGIGGSLTPAPNPVP